MTYQCSFACFVLTQNLCGRCLLACIMKLLVFIDPSTIFSMTDSIVTTGWKVSIYGVFSGPHFFVFSPNTRKYGPEKTPHSDTFHAVKSLFGLLRYSELNLTKLSNDYWRGIRPMLQTLNPSTSYISISTCG